MNLSQKEISHIISYDPNTGICIWKNPIAHVSIGNIVGWKSKQGYIHTSIRGKKYLLHRLVWLYYYGVLPSYEIDHINQNKSDNRIKNLREVTRQCNMRNRGNYKNSWSGVKGVAWNKTNNNWRVTIRVNKKGIELGSYKDFNNAVCARLAGEQRLDWSGCESSSPAYQYVQRMLGRE